MPDKDVVKRNLEAAFDIPFFVQMSYENSEPVFLLAPEDSGKELFSIKVSFRNQVMVTMDFIPRKYSVNFIHSMWKDRMQTAECFLLIVRLCGEKVPES